MQNNRNDQLGINPVESYEAPKIPTLSDDNTAALKKLPSRWQKNAKVIACIGLMGTLTLSNLAFPFAASPVETAEITTPPAVTASYNGYSNFELELRLHHGGAGGAWYVVHLTEQEVFGFIRKRLEAAGLTFGATPPNYIAVTRETISGFDSVRYEDGVRVLNFGLNLFDENRNVAIAHIGERRHLRERVIVSFAEQTEDIAVGVFYTPTSNLGSSWEWCEETEGIINREPSAEEVTSAGIAMKEHLTTQIDNFISRLQFEGILETDTPSIIVTLNGTLLEFDVTPIIVDNRTLVPFRAIFEALGMEVEWIDNNRTAVGRRGDELIIELRHDQDVAMVNGEIVQLDTPVILHHDRTMVPLRFVAEATGATVEWDEETNTVEITNENYIDISEIELSIRAHGGGSPPIPFYVVHLTEQEAFGIIRDLLEAEGVNLDTPTTEHTAVVRQRFRDWRLYDMEGETAYIDTETNVGVDLSDEEKGVGITKFSGNRRHLTGLAAEAFAEQIEGITVGTFYNPEHTIGDTWDFGDDRDQMIAEAKAEAAPILRERLIIQVQEFIEFLRNEGIIN